MAGVEHLAALPAGLSAALTFSTMQSAIKAKSLPDIAIFRRA